MVFLLLAKTCIMTRQDQLNCGRPTPQMRVASFQTTPDIWEEPQHLTLYLVVSSPVVMTAVTSTRTVHGFIYRTHSHTGVDTTAAFPYLMQSCLLVALQTMVMTPSWYQRMAPAQFQAHFSLWTDGVIALSRYRRIHLLWLEGMTQKEEWLNVPWMENVKFFLCCSRDELTMHADLTGRVINRSPFFCPASLDGFPAYPVKSNISISFSITWICFFCLISSYVCLSFVFLFYPAWSAIVNLMFRWSWWQEAIAQMWQSTKARRWQATVSEAHSGDLLEIFLLLAEGYVLFNLGTP